MRGRQRGAGQASGSRETEAGSEGGQRLVGEGGKSGKRRGGSTFVVKGLDDLFADLVRVVACLPQPEGVAPRHQNSLRGREARWVFVKRGAKGKGRGIHPDHDSKATILAPTTHRGPPWPSRMAEDGRAGAPLGSEAPRRGGGLRRPLLA